jgi:hypothetical protein
MYQEQHHITPAARITMLQNHQFLTPQLTQQPKLPWHMHQPKGHLMDTASIIE